MKVYSNDDQPIVRNFGQKIGGIRNDYSNNNF